MIWLVVVLWGTCTIAFALVHILPGDPARVIAGPKASAEAIETLRVKWELDKPFLVQYVNYMKRVLHGDLGRSYWFKMEVFPALVDRLPATGILATASLLIGLLLGIPAGVISAVRQHSWLDTAVMFTSILGITLPAFFVGLLLLYLFAFRIPVFPLGGYGSASQLILPAATLGIRAAAWYARVLRSTMLDILGEDYIRTAKAKGVRDYAVIARHALPNALGPIVTMVGADMGNFLGGVLVVEKVFSWPGMGLLAWNAVGFRDMPTIMGTLLFGAFFVVLANLVVDVFQVLVDPRIRYQ